MNIIDILSIIFYLFFLLSGGVGAATTTVGRTSLSLVLSTLVLPLLVVILLGLQQEPEMFPVLPPRFNLTSSW